MPRNQPTTRLQSEPAMVTVCVEVVPATSNWRVTVSALSFTVSLRIGIDTTVLTAPGSMSSDTLACSR